MRFAILSVSDFRNTFLYRAHDLASFFRSISLDPPNLLFFFSSLSSVCYSHPKERRRKDAPRIYICMFFQLRTTCSNLSLLRLGEKKQQRTNVHEVGRNPPRQSAPLAPHPSLNPVPHLVHIFTNPYFDLLASLHRLYCHLANVLEYTIVYQRSTTYTRSKKFGRGGLVFAFLRATTFRKRCDMCLSHTQKLTHVL